MGRHSCCQKHNLIRKGLWSPDEDAKLINHITRYGFECWSSVPKQTGLQRCGKSCRLRWINYLRPDLKRGSFSAVEEKLIIELHKMLGNRWSQIASHLPGRTDNEIKNFWNSCLKKKFKQAGVDPTTHEPIIAIHQGEINSANPNSGTIASQELSRINESIMQSSVRIKMPNPVFNVEDHDSNMNSSEQLLQFLSEKRLGAPSAAVTLINNQDNSSLINEGHAEEYYINAISRTSGDYQSSNESTILANTSTNYTRPDVIKSKPLDSKANHGNHHLMLLDQDQLMQIGSVNQAFFNHGPTDQAHKLPTLLALENMPADDIQGLSNYIMECSQMLECKYQTAGLVLEGLNYTDYSKNPDQFACLSAKTAAVYGQLAIANPDLERGLGLHDHNSPSSIDTGGSLSSIDNKMCYWTGLISAASSNDQHSIMEQKGFDYNWAANSPTNPEPNSELTVDQPLHGEDDPSIMQSSSWHMHVDHPINLPQSSINPRLMKDYDHDQLIEPNSMQFDNWHHQLQQNGELPDLYGKRKSVANVSSDMQFIAAMLDQL